MQHLDVISDSPSRAADLKVRLRGHFEAQYFQLDELPQTAPGACTFVDINLRHHARVSHLKRWLKQRPTRSRVIFGVNRDSYLESIQAYAIGATGLLPRPIDGQLLSWKMSGGLGAISAHAGAITGEAHEAIAPSANALQNIFAAAMTGEAPDIQLLDAAGAHAVNTIEEKGLTRWLETVRCHHSQTYQHCLLVTAVAVSFGQLLGFRHDDRQRLASASLLHDIGKAQIPVEILEKPGPLTESEQSVMKTHPELGLEALRSTPGLQPEMTDMVVHHHEYLDGSGYPHGLQANDLSDLVRTITIADIFSALIERRSYKKPLSGEAAYQILQEMGPKLDKDLVREFRPLARSVA